MSQRSAHCSCSWWRSFPERVQRFLTNQQVQNNTIALALCINWHEHYKTFCIKKNITVSDIYYLHVVLVTQYLFRHDKPSFQKYTKAPICLFKHQPLLMSHGGLLCHYYYYHYHHHILFHIILSHVITFVKSHCKAIGLNCIVTLCCTSIVCVVS